MHFNCMLLHGSQQSLHFYSFFFVFVFISVLFIIFYAFFLLFTSFCSLSFTGKQDILAPDQPYEGNYGQGPSSVHSNQDGGRSYRQGTVFSPFTHLDEHWRQFKVTTGFLNTLFDCVMCSENNYFCVNYHWSRADVHEIVADFAKKLQQITRGKIVGSSELNIRTSPFAWQKIWKKKLAIWNSKIF